MIVVDLLPQTSRRQVLTAGVSSVDGCPVLTRLKAYMADQGTAVALSHTFIDRRTGVPMDLSQYFDLPDSESDSSSVMSSVVLRVKEALAVGSSCDNQLWEVDGLATDPAVGEVRAELPTAVTDRPGVYQLSWGVKDAATDELVLTSSALLSVDRSLFGNLDDVLQDRGPLTVQTLRLYMRDSHPNENMRLNDVEFGAEEILGALLRPVEYYNEQPPPIRKFNTRNFPSRYNWSQAAIGSLYEMAAAWYRRNKQQIQAGGLADDDLNRDRDYEQKAQQLWQAYREWVIQDKVMRNARMVTGEVGSIYRRW